jgi:hypothetical protein
MSGFGTDAAEGGNGFTTIGANPGSNLVSMLAAEDIVPGAQPSYQLCKTIYLYHPLGAKIVEAPIRLAQSQRRDLSIPGAPERRLIDAYWDAWDTIGGRDINGSAISADVIIRNVMVTSRIYGIATLIVGERGKENSHLPLKLDEIGEADLYFNVLDPLNTSGSLVLDQDPNSPDFQKARGVTVGTRTYHPSHCVVMMNEQPVYIAFTPSAFGYVGRSAYQRALFPLKTFLQTMITDQYVSLKVGLLIAKMRAPGPVINNRIANFFGWKRSQLQSGITGNVLSIGIGDGFEEKIESLNFQNLEGPAAMVRNHALKNIAMAAGQPSKLLEMEEMIGGMAEGTEDAKQIAHYIDGVRTDMQPLYRFMDRLVMRKAWGPDFYKIIQKTNLEYKNTPYETAFYKWVNAFRAEWPNLLEEPDSEKMKSEEIRFKSAVAVYEVLTPNLDPENKAAATEWLADEVNARRDLFTAKLDIDAKALAKFGEEQNEQQKQASAAGPAKPGAAPSGSKAPAQPKPFASTT